MKPFQWTDYLVMELARQFIIYKCRDKGKMTLEQFLEYFKTQHK